MINDEPVSIGTDLYGESKITRIETFFYPCKKLRVINLYGESKITRIETVHY